MAGRVCWLGLLASAVLAAVFWFSRPTPCTNPIAYRLDQIDDRFGMSRDEVLDVLRRAEAVWERALGRTAFVHDPGAVLTVNLIYDERQQTTRGRARLRHALGESRASLAAVGQTLAQWQMTYEGRVRDLETAHAEYRERVRAYSARAQQWNGRGGAPRETQARLESERSQLEAMRRQIETDRASLEELAATVKGLVTRGNAIAEAHNRDVNTFNGLYGAPRQFHKGEFDGRSITVFEFHDARDFALVLAHELGHALGLGHVDDPTAIMHAIGREQTVDPLALTAADVAALRTVCRARRI